LRCDYSDDRNEASYEFEHANSSENTASVYKVIDHHTPKLGGFRLRFLEGFGTCLKVEKMALELKSVCEKCGATLAPKGVAYICSYECTFCANCTEQMNFICPNCEGELVRRPRRKKAPTSGDAAGV
jgi:hypothetical protein